MRFPWTFALALLLLTLLAVTCGNRDDRDRVRSDFGEPDRIEARGIDPFWREIWFYDQLGLGFEFRRTSGCGSFRDVYLFQQFAYQPVPGDSSGVGKRKLVIPPRTDNPISPY